MHILDFQYFLVKEHFSCSSSGGRGYVGGRNIFLHLHNRFMFIVHLRFVGSLSLHCYSLLLSWWKWSESLLSLRGPLLWLWMDKMTIFFFLKDEDTLLCLNLLACSFPIWFGFVGLSGIDYPIDRGQRAQCYMHSLIQYVFVCFFFLNELFFKNLLFQHIEYKDWGKQWRWYS